MKKIIMMMLFLLCVFFVSCDQITSTTSSTSTTAQQVTTTTNQVTTTTTQITTVPTTTVPVTTTITTTQPTTTEATTTIVTTETEEPIRLEMTNDSLKILQLTDLHLRYSLNNEDIFTLNLVSRLVNSDTYDLVVFTGDLTLSPTGPAYFLQLINLMESLETPWTFCFGNHEDDYNEYQEFIDVIPNDTEYLYFKVGPALEGGGYGNFVIEFTKNGVPFYDMILMDSHSERENYTPAEGKYDYIKESQVDWYNTIVSRSTVDNLVFMHIPLRQFLDTENYVGEFNEYVCPQGRDTGLFDAFVNYGKTKGLFVGHDHLNDFLLEREGIILAYGRNTGFGGYGEIERGGRVIEVSSSQEISTYLILESDLT